MTSARDLPDAIQWHEGMMLAPQHFQQQSTRFEQLMLYHVMAAAPYHWGVLQLSLDRAALVSGMVRVLELEAVLPDGLVVSYGGGQALDLDISGYADQIGQVPLTVYLAVPVARAGAAAPGDLARYDSADGPVVVDENTGEGELRIPRLKPRLTLLATLGHGQKPPQKYVSIPLARIVYRDEAFALTDYMPPTLRVETHSGLGKLCSDIARRAREKALYLSERAGAASAGSQPMLQETMAEIRSLVTGLPPLEALVSSGTAHPFTLYLALCGVVGHMAAFAAGASPPVLSRYDHDDLLASFGEIRDFTFRMLDRVKESYVGLPFHFENGKFGIHLEEAWLKRKLVIGVRAPATMGEKDVVQWLDNSLIASRKRIEKLWEMRVMGAARQVLAKDNDLDIVPGRGVVLFSIDNDPQYISAGDVLEIWNSDARGMRTRPSEIVLYVRSET